MAIVTHGLAFGDDVLIPWGLGETRGIVQDIYGPAGRRHVVVLLDPATSGVVAEPTTVSTPIESVTRLPGSDLPALPR